MTIKEIESAYNWLTGLSMIMALLIELTGIILLLTRVPKNKVEVYKFFKGLEEMEQIKKEENEKIQ